MEITSPEKIIRDEIYVPLEKILQQEGDIGFITNGPKLVKKKLTQNPKILESLKFCHANKGYTRKKVIGDLNKNVIIAMEWSPNYYLQPHEHHGRPCFDLVISGRLLIIDYNLIELENGFYKLEQTKQFEVKEGDFVIVDPRFGEVHDVRSLERTKSLHFYPDDNYHSFGYVLNGNDNFQRKRFELTHD